VVVGPLLVIAYNADLFGGAVHTDVGFALCWGAFPLLTAYVAQAETCSLAAVVSAAGAAALSLAQRRLSTPARRLRRQVAGVRGVIEMRDGSEVPVDRQYVLHPLEQALSALAWAIVLLATGFAVTRLG
jgi:hypothetical protein